MSESSNWTDKAKAVVITVGAIILILLIWQWQKPKIDPEDYAKTLAAKQAAEEQNKKYGAERQAGLERIAALEKNGTALAVIAKDKDKKIISLERFNDELLKAKCEDVEPLKIAYGDLWNAKIACDDSSVSKTLRLEAMTELYNKCDVREKSTSEKLAIQTQETMNCQEKGMDGGWGVYAGLGYGVMSVDGDIKSGWVVTLSIGKRLLKLPEIF